MGELLYCIIFLVIVVHFGNSVGAIALVTVELKESEILYIVVGQKSREANGGSGGTFVAKKVNQTFKPLVIAGGAGGDCSSSRLQSCSATYTEPDARCRIRFLRDGTGFSKIFSTDGNHISNDVVFFLVGTKRGAR